MTDPGLLGADARSPVSSSSPSARRHWLVRGLRVVSRSSPTTLTWRPRRTPALWRYSPAERAGSGETSQFFLEQGTGLGTR